jgi:hypothetical protein
MMAIALTEGFDPEIGGILTLGHKNRLTFD